MPPSAALSPHRWTRREYESMVERGVFQPEDRLELIDGEVLDVSPQSSRHSAATSLVERALRAILPERYLVRVQMPLALGERSEPEPDVAVVEGGPRDFVDGHPVTAALVVEVSEASLAFDRESKAALYAASGIEDYWIVNLPEHRLEVRRGPRQGAYCSIVELSPSETVSPLVAPDRSIPIRDLLP